MSRQCAELLQNSLRKIKEAGKGRTYDCILGLSGGVDSSYMAYLANQWGLRPLVVHFDNGWDDELAVGNIEIVVKKLRFTVADFCHELAGVSRSAASLFQGISSGPGRARRSHDFWCPVQDRPRAQDSICPVGQ